MRTIKCSPSSGFLNNYFWGRKINSIFAKCILDDIAVARIFDPDEMKTFITLRYRAVPNT